VVSWDETHLLYQVWALLNFKPLEQLCAEYHHQNGRGRWATHTVPKLIRALILRYLEDLSLRETEERVRYHMMYKWFCGYALFEHGPDHTRLHRFEQWVLTHHPRAFFDTVLKQIDQDIPSAGQQIQMADTFALLANASLEGLTRRLRHASKRLLTVLKKEDPVGYNYVFTHLDNQALFGTKNDKSGYDLHPQEREARRMKTAQAVIRLVTLVREQNGGEQVAEWLGWLEKILTDEFELQSDATGQPVVLRVYCQKERGTYPVYSATDPEATMRNHGENKQDFGYNVSVATTTDFVREVQVATGSEPDPVALPALLSNQLEHHQHVPEKILYDQAAGSGKVAVTVQTASQGQTQLVAKPMYETKAKKSKRFTAHDCTINEDERVLTCPEGRITSRKYRSGSGDGYTFRFPAPYCQGCQLLLACRGSDKPPTTPRNFFLSDYHLAYQQLVAYSKTKIFAQEMKQRPQVERVIAGLVRYNGARRARFRGLAKVDYQMKMCATSYNLKRWVQLHTKRSHLPLARGSPTSSAPSVSLA
jgi:IS5 family transposase